MSGEHNRDALERWYRAFNARDFLQLGALLDEFADPDVENGLHLTAINQATVPLQASRK